MKKQIARITSALLALLSFIFPACAEEVEWYPKEDVMEFVNLLTEDKKAALEFKCDNFHGDSGGEFFVFTDEELEHFRSNKAYFLKINIDYSDLHDYSGIYVFEFFTSDYKEYVYKLDFTQRNILTINEILSESGITDSGKIVYAGFRYFDCPDVSEYSFIKYKNGWQIIGDDRYYVKYNGTLAVKSTVINGIRYKFSSDGVCHGKYTGWTKSDSGRRYWKDGKLIKNKWLKTKSGKRYYADEKGYVTLSERTD